MSMSSKQLDQLTKVLLVGCGPTALSALEALGESFHVVGLVREPQGHCTDEDETIRRATRLSVPVYPKPSLRLVERLIDELKPVCVVVSSFNRVLPGSLLARCRFANVHYSPLPRYRGRANVNWAIINGEKLAGITIHTIVPGLDDGPILFQQLIPIHSKHTVADIYEALNAIQRAQLAGAVQKLLDGDPGLPQSEEDASYACSRNPEDGEIDWSKSARQIHDLIRALVSPYPGAFTYLQGRRLTILVAECLKDAPHYEGRIPGRVIAVARAQGFIDVLAGDGVVRIHDVQWDGGPRITAAQAVTSVRETLGLRMSDLLTRIERLESMIRTLTQSTILRPGSASSQSEELRDP
jgi:methionyl-tRNA formyltransferase